MLNFPALPAILGLVRARNCTVMRVVALTSMLSMALGLGGCGVPDDQPATPPGADLEYDAGPPPSSESGGDCDHAGVPGCPCGVEGQVASCGVVHSKTTNGSTICGYGESTCTAAGEWGPCLINNTSPLADFDGGIPDYRPQGLGGSNNCTKNPCDPYCKTFNGDTPAGLGGTNVVSTGPTLTLSADAGAADAFSDAAVDATPVTTTCTGGSTGSCTHSLCSVGSALSPNCDVPAGSCTTPTFPSKPADSLIDSAATNGKYTYYTPYSSGTSWPSRPAQVGGVVGSIYTDTPPTFPPDAPVTYPGNSTPVWPGGTFTPTYPADTPANLSALYPNKPVTWPGNVVPTWPTNNSATWPADVPATLGNSYVSPLLPNQPPIAGTNVSPTWADSPVTWGGNPGTPVFANPGSAKNQPGNAPVTAAPDVPITIGGSVSVTGAAPTVATQPANQTPSFPSTTNAVPPQPITTPVAPAPPCPAGWSTVNNTVTAFFDDFSGGNSKGWSLGPEWQIGTAKPSSGHVYGFSDPSFDASPTGDNMLAGVIIGGNASLGLHGYYYLTSPAFNTNGTGPVTLSFNRWLNSDYVPYMNNTVEVFNGSSWVLLWQNGSAGVTDSSWNTWNFDVTAYRNASMRVRFGFNITSGGVYTVSQWNLDDVRVQMTAPSTCVKNIADCNGYPASSCPSGYGCGIVNGIAQCVKSADSNCGSVPTTGPYACPANTMCAVVGTQPTCVWNKAVCPSSGACSGANYFCKSGTGQVPQQGVTNNNVTAFFDDFSSGNTKGWSLGPEWQIGTAKPSSGHVYGFSDPAIDASPTADNMLAGVIIGGNASLPLHDYYYLTSPAFNTTGTGTVQLSFNRWLNSDYVPYMNNRVEVFNGSSWVVLWENGSAGVTDSSWNTWNFDVTAHRNASMRVRFGFNITSGGVYTVSQWNLDDVRVQILGGASGGTEAVCVHNYSVCDGLATCAAGSACTPGAGASCSNGAGCSGGSNALCTSTPTCPAGTSQTACSNCGSTTTAATVTCSYNKDCSNVYNVATNKTVSPAPSSYPTSNWYCAMSGAQPVYRARTDVCGSQVSCSAALAGGGANYNCQVLSGAATCVWNSWVCPPIANGPCPAGAVCSNNPNATPGNVATCSYPTSSCTGATCSVAGTKCDASSGQAKCTWDTASCSGLTTAGNTCPSGASCCPAGGNCLKPNTSTVAVCQYAGTSCTGATCPSGYKCGTGGTTGTAAFFDDFSSGNAKGWQLGPEWQIGKATPSSGHVYGFGDPSVDATPTADNMLAGVIIGGNASLPLHGYYYLTSPAFNTNGTGPVTLSFQRWLNSDYTPYMDNVVDVFDGVSWVTIWKTGSSPGIQDSSWVPQSFDVTAYRNASMRVRFGFQITSGGVFTVSQWNVDDVRVEVAGATCSPDPASCAAYTCPNGFKPQLVSGACGCVADPTKCEGHQACNTGFTCTAGTPNATCTTDATSCGSANCPVQTGYTNMICAVKSGKPTCTYDPAKQNICSPVPANTNGLPSPTCPSGYVCATGTNPVTCAPDKTTCSKAICGAGYTCQLVGGAPTCVFTNTTSCANGASCAVHGPEYTCKDVGGPPSKPECVFSSVTYFYDDFSTGNSKGLWQLGPEWQIGTAKPSSGHVYGFGDPSFDATPTADNMLAGVVIGGNASLPLHGYYYLTSPAVNTTGTLPVNLSFQRWLNSDYTPYMDNVVEVFNGASWVTIWKTGSSPGIQDSSWQPQSFDVTAYRNANFRVRFGFQITSGGVFTVSQWNVDDVRIGSPTATSCANCTAANGCCPANTVCGLVGGAPTCTYDKNSCLGATCQSGYKCNAGAPATCSADTSSCLVASCPAGFTCQAGTPPVCKYTSTNVCPGTANQCPSNYSCVVNNNVPTCTVNKTSCTSASCTAGSCQLVNNVPTCRQTTNCSNFPGTSICNVDKCCKPGCPPATGQADDFLYTTAVGSTCERRDCGLCSNAPNPNDTCKGCSYELASTVAPDLGQPPAQAATMLTPTTPAGWVVSGNAQQLSVTVGGTDDSYRTGTLTASSALPVGSLVVFQWDGTTTNARPIRLGVNRTATAPALALMNKVSGPTTSEVECYSGQPAASGYQNRQICILRLTKALQTFSYALFNNTTLTTASGGGTTGTLRVTAYSCPGANVLPNSAVTATYLNTGWDTFKQVFERPGFDAAGTSCTTATSCYTGTLPSLGQCRACGAGLFAREGMCCQVPTAENNGCQKDNGCPIGTFKCGPNGTQCCKATCPPAGFAAFTYLNTSNSPATCEQRDCSVCAATGKPCAQSTPPSIQCCSQYPSCVATVCATNPFCCTNGWTQTCVDAAKTLCNVSCVGTGPSQTCAVCYNDAYDHDGDGYSAKCPALGGATNCGDCLDCAGGSQDPKWVNPGAIDIAGNGLDDDCDGTKDNPIVNCDTAPAPALSTSNGFDYARAIGLCSINPPAGKWGVVSASLAGANGSVVPGATSYGVVQEFGAFKVQEGGRMAAFSSGTARPETGVDSVGFIKPKAIYNCPACLPGSKSWNINSTLPAGFPKATAGCPAPIGGTAFDTSGLKMSIRVPTNALSFSYSLNFMSSEYSEWVCSPFNDSFISLLTSNHPANVANWATNNGNIAFDANNKPLSVNNNFFIVTSQAQLAGTGFGGTNCGNKVCGGATGWLTNTAPVNPGETIQIQYAIWDTGDTIYDSSVLIDNWKWSTQTAQIQLGAAPPAPNNPPPPVYSSDGWFDRDYDLASACSGQPGTGAMPGLWQWTSATPSNSYIEFYIVRGDTQASLATNPMYPLVFDTQWAADMQGKNAVAKNVNTAPVYSSGSASGSTDVGVTIQKNSLPSTSNWLRVRSRLVASTPGYLAAPELAAWQLDVACVPNQ